MEGNFLEKNVEQKSQKQKKKNHRQPLTPISTLHYFKLVYRSALLIAAALVYILRYVSLKGETVTGLLDSMPVIPIIIWIVFAVEMTLRFFPNRFESPGCQKQFGKNYIKSGETEIHVEGNHSVILILLIWIVINGIFGALKLNGLLSNSIMLILCCGYSVCDMICILFFCPFQTWFMKNKCCGTCRIYNWDYAMMFTPLFFVPGIYSWSLLALSVVLLFRWEITYYFHPERFAENTNSYLKCSNCTEKLCRHKKQLRSVWINAEELAKKRMEKLRK